ncbi:hypothetical protein ABMA28_004891 [Loxostege sticticalis]|uniref:MADF domain-containing protein n=1 Tax=Loxostege sticticalis TaxID=481309 RepID=A0ABD0SQV0_LOXSC
MFVSDASILRISEEKTLELVELYKQEQCLWDTNSRDYRIKMKRREAAEKIARILDLPNFKARHVMMKFKNLRNAYCQELKKIAIAQNLGSEEDAVPRKSKQRAQWYAVMDSFIRPHLQANYSYSGPTLVINGGIIKREPEPEPIDDPDELWDNTASEEVSSDIPKPAEDDSETVRPQRSQFAVRSQFDACSESGEGDTPEFETNKRAASNSRSSSPKRMRSEELLADSLKEVSSQLAVLKDDMAKRKVQKAQNEEDFHDNFGKYVASLLRLLPTRKALLLQPKIVNMIAAEVLEDGEENFE